MHPSRTESPSRATSDSLKLSRLLTRAKRALTKRQFDKADAALGEALVVDPQCVEAYRLRAVSLQVRGRHHEALKPLHDALTLAPENALVCMSLGVALCEVGDHENALSYFQSACRLKPDLAAAWFNMGKLLKLQTRSVEAKNALQHAVQLDEAHHAARQLLADVQVNLGEIRQAQANYRQILRAAPERAQTWWAMANLKSNVFTGQDVIALRKLLAEPRMTDFQRVMLGFTLAAALEDQDEYAHAFRVLERANALEHKRQPWDASAFQTHVQHIQKAFRVPAVGARDQSLGERIIFYMHSSVGFHSGRAHIGFSFAG